MAITILKEHDEWFRNFGAGLDRDGPPRDGTVEHYCVNRSHPPDLPRRFDAPANCPNICIPCQKANWAAHLKAETEGMPDGNNPLQVARVTRGVAAKKSIIWTPPGMA